MEDQIYETQPLAPTDLRKFTKFLDKEIATIRAFENSLGESV